MATLHAGAREMSAMYRRRKRVNWAFATLATLTAATSIPFVAFLVLAGLT